MKWGIIALIILGLVAAACAAVLVGALRIDTSASAGEKEKSSPGVEVALARASLPAMTVITIDHVVKEAVSKGDLPQGEQLCSPTGVIGRVLDTPVVEGQILTESWFVTSGTGALLAAALPHGMRAVTVGLSGKIVPDPALLYPGCVVDVLVSFRLSSSASKGQALSTTMLRGIQVLAISGDTVVSSPDDDAKAGARGRRTSSGSAKATLLVNPKQAEALQLAAENGSVSLTIRNPLDSELVHIEGTVLSQGTLANLGSVLTVFPGAQRKPIPHLEQAQDQENSPFVGTNVVAERSKSDEVRQQVQQVRKYPRWGVTVIRGRDTKLEELALPEGESIEGAIEQIKK